MADSATSRGTEGMLALRVAGALAGVVYVPGLDSPVSSLRQEVARLLGAADPSCIKLIVGGRTLQDDQRPLSAAGVSPSSRILVTRGAEGAGSVAGAADQQRRLEAVKAAAEKLAARDSRGLTDKYSFDVENQFGGSVALRPEDRRALVVGLTLHSKGRASLEQRDYACALEELMVAEEALALCDKQLTESIDNVPMLLLDIVWVCYKLGDLRRLAVCRDRLQRARAGLARAHGPNLERLRSMHGQFTPELATYVRLEVLEGLVAYYSQEPREVAERALRVAQARWSRLQVSDSALAQLQVMGYDLREATRGLRFAGGDVATAVDFIEQQRQAERERKAKRARTRDWQRERVQYGKTASGNYVDQQQLDGLQGMGYARSLAAEALRRADNRGQEALDVLSTPARRRALEMDAVLQQALKQAGSGAAPAADAQTASLAASLAAALASAPPQQPASAAAGPSGSGSAPAPAHAPAASSAGGQAASGGAGGPGAGQAQQPGEQQPQQQQPEEAEEDDEQARDAEQALLSAVRSEDDPLAAYDLDMSEEGDIIATFLTLLASAGEGQGQGQAGGSAAPGATAGAR